ncbi:FMN-binding negative transcriptional regulator [Ruegeria marina]|uniref:Negative transcriptional regulator, PaiB family n=1 Tax=Ruegeria marina TaxID=639004 RepID=A0A1G7BW97_9RHOB|nr:FMN-binding negative transcriptional regulator [Ruegeria marina]SDE31262.1 negative transcriptional regulator, PaiB family [Ruegeria marina]
MHPNLAFRGESTARNLEFARARGFGVLAMAAQGAPLISHVPFLLNPAGDVVELHLVRSNPIVRLLAEPVPGRLVVSGPDSYVSPDWYGMEEQVPTWNYVAVHLVGRLELRPQEEMRGLLDRLSAEFEGRLSPKVRWVADKMQPEGLERMMRMIVPCRFRIEDVQGTWKLGQNKPDAARMGAAEALEKAGTGAEVAALAALMRAVS